MQGLNITDLLSEHSQVLHSKGDVRRAIKGNALALNKIKITNHDFVVTAKELLKDQFLLVENGKKNKFILIID